VGITAKAAAAVSGLSAPAGQDRALAVVTLAVWVCTASIGGYMLRRWVLRGGLRRPPPTGETADAPHGEPASADAPQGEPASAKPPAGRYPAATWPDGGAGTGGREQRLPPGVIIGHFSLALTGLLLWALFVVSGWQVLAWSATGVLMPAIGLGVCTVTLWTPYPTYPDPFAPAAAVGPAGGTGHARRGSAGTVTGPAGGMLAGPEHDVLAARLTDEALARALTDEALATRLTDDVVAQARPGVAGRDRRRPKGHLAPLIPVAHGMGALVTFLLAVLTAIGAR
jgi:hypothetical protein